MRFGCQTIIFGPTVANWDEVFEQTADAGFQGVELFQPASEIAPTITELLDRLGKHGLTLIGLAGDDIYSRQKYLGEYRNPYLYADRFEAAEREALEAGYTVALHPHVFKKMHRVEDAEAILNDPAYQANKERLLFLPDTAHLTIVGDDPGAAIRKHRTRLAAVHIKGWDSSHGRASYRCSRGFTSISRGEVDIKSILDQLADRSYPEDLWVLLEQDFPERSPALDLYDGARQLMTWGHMPKRGFRLLQASERAKKKTVADQASPEDQKLELEYRQYLDSVELLRNGEVFGAVIEPFRELLRDVRVSVLSAYREDSQNLVVLGISGAPKMGDDPLIRPPDAPSAVKLISANAPIMEAISPPLQFWERDLPASFRRARIPILNPYNRNHVRFILDLYVKAGAVTWNAPIKWEQTALAWRFREILGRYLDHAVDRNCQDYAGSVIRIAANGPTYEEFTRGLRALITRAIGCEAVAVFMADSSLTVMRPVGSEDVLEWRADLPQGKHYYLMSETRMDTVKAWTRALPLFLPSPLGDRLDNSWKCVLKVSDHGTGEIQILHFPILGADGRCIGVVRCGGKLPPARYFHENDLAILDAILHVAVPRLLSLRRDHERRMEVGIVAHELKRPALAIRTAVEMIGKEFAERQQRFGIPMLDYPWVEDVMSWCDLMSACLTNPEYFKLEAPLRVEPVRMLGGVVAPIVRMLSLYLAQATSLPAYHQEDGRRVHSIEQGTFENIDRPLHIDKNKFQQVIFNLLDNAIKYAKPGKPEEFRVKFFTEFRDDAYWIRVRDWGIGIDKNSKDPNVLFEQGVRGPRAHVYQAAGTGYGLWIVRKLLELHQCSISITNRAEPTEFSIRIPKMLTRSGWQRDAATTRHLT